MSRIFLSHCSADEREAVALRQWLRDRRGSFAAGPRGRRRGSEAHPCSGPG
jgi:hypothetical protein